MSTDSPAPLTLAEAIAIFVNDLADAPRTQKTYRTGLLALTRFVADQYGGSTEHPNVPAATLSLASLDHDLLHSFYLWMSKRGYGNFTIRTYLAATTALLNYLDAHELLPATFSIEKARRRLRERAKRVIYPRPQVDEELPQIVLYYDKLELPPDDTPSHHRQRLTLLRSRAIVHTLYASAGRISEIASLTRADVAEGRKDEVYLRVTKGDRPRTIFLTAQAQAAIKAYLAARSDDHPGLFISHGRDAGKRLSAVSLWATVKQAARALNMDVTPHQFRHYRATQMLNEGAPLEAIQDILGHADIATTKKVYAGYLKPQLRDIYDTYTRTPDEAMADLAAARGKAGRRRSDRRPQDSIDKPTPARV